MARTNGPKSTTIGFGAVLLVIIITAGFVFQMATDAVLESESGSLSSVVSDPDAAGFRAFTEPTETLLVHHRASAAFSAGQDQDADPENPGEPIVELRAVTLLAGGDAQSGGTVITIPATFRGDRSGDENLAELFERAGPGAVTDELSNLLGVEFSEVVSLNASGFVEFLDVPDGLRLTLRDDLAREVEGVRRVVLGEGTRSFAPDELRVIAAHVNQDEASIEPALRIQEVWQSWISGTPGDDVIGGSGDVFEEVLAQLRSGEVSYQTLNTDTEVDEETSTDEYVFDEEASARLIASAIPVPRSPGVSLRPTVSLIDAANGRVDKDSTIREINILGGTVSVVGNDAASQASVSSVEIHNEEATPFAQELAAAFGVAQPTEALDADSPVSITLTLAPDASSAE